MDLLVMGRDAKEMARYVAQLDTRQKNEVLLTCADALEGDHVYILEENEKDMQQADPKRAAFNDRLALNSQRISAMADGLRKLARLDDPVNEVLYMRTMESGLQISEQRVPLGVVGMIYEARPNVTVDAFGLCFKAGNVCILRGGSEAINSNIAMVEVLQNALDILGHPRKIIQLVTDLSREVARQLMTLDRYIDVLIPRGGAGLIRSTVENSTIPVIETGIGNCHIYVDKSADLDKAVDIIINAKIQRPSVCNACEKLLVHKDLAYSFIPQIYKALSENGVEVKGDPLVCEIVPEAIAAEDDDWYTEFLDLVIAIKVVDGIDEALDHISKYSSGHTDAILSESYTEINRFVREVDSAAVLVNASTRFTDGEEFGLGAEIGISTQKLHARGPMGLKALTSSKFVVYGSGQVR